jgi:hypothetical protein
MVTAVTSERRFMLVVQYGWVPLHNGSVRIAPFNAGIMRAPLLRLSHFFCN